jgi:hypothetical protein
MRKKGATKKYLVKLVNTIYTTPIIEVVVILKAAISFHFYINYSTRITIIKPNKKKQLKLIKSINTDYYCVLVMLKIYLY